MPDKSLDPDEPQDKLRGSYPMATSAKVDPRFPLPALATWHRPTARALRALAPDRLAPGHGGVVEEPLAAMDAAIAAADS